MSDVHTSREPTIEVRSPQPHAVLVVLGGEHDLSSAEELRQTFDQSLGRCDHLIVDLSAAEFIDSTTIRVLMETRKHALERDRKLSVVLGTAAIVERVLEVSGILTARRRRPHRRTGTRRVVRDATCHVRGRACRGAHGCTGTAPGQHRFANPALFARTAWLNHAGSARLSPSENRRSF